MDDTTDSIVSTAIAAAIRHGLSIVAGGLVGLGWIQSSQTASFVDIGVGIAVGALAYGWSLWQKKGVAAVKTELGRLKLENRSLKAEKGI